jgi:uncharacterized protein (TIGR02646 family)
MKGITKNTEPTIFTNWKAQANDDWQPTFDKLRGTEKKAVSKSLIEEQGFLCAYCCCRINSNNTGKDKDMGGNAIEHFIPQSIDPTKELDYNNFFIVCSGIKKDINEKKNKKIKTIPENEHCCDTYKGAKLTSSTNPMIIQINPTEIDNISGNFICEEAFVYAIDGKIEAKEGSKYEQQAKHTIDILNLNVPQLKAERRNLIEDILYMKATSSVSAINQLKMAYKSKHKNQREEYQFQEYCNAALFFL